MQFSGIEMYQNFEIQNGQIYAHCINKGAATCDFQQCGLLTSVDSYELVQPPFKHRDAI